MFVDMCPRHVTHEARIFFGLLLPQASNCKEQTHSSYVSAEFTDTIATNVKGMLLHCTKISFGIQERSCNDKIIIQSGKPKGRVIFDRRPVHGGTRCKQQTDSLNTSLLSCSYQRGIAIEISKVLLRPCCESNLTTSLLPFQAAAVKGVSP